MRRVQAVANGSGDAGCSVNCDAGDAVRMVSAIGDPHCSSKAAGVTFTDSLNVTVRSAPTATFVPPLRGVVAVTFGASSSDGFAATDPMKTPAAPADGL